MLQNPTESKLAEFWDPEGPRAVCARGGSLRRLQLYRFLAGVTLGSEESSPVPALVREQFAGHATTLSVRRISEETIPEAQ